MRVVFRRLSLVTDVLTTRVVVIFRVKCLGSSSNDCISFGHGLDWSVCCDVIGHENMKVEMIGHLLFYYVLHPSSFQIC